MTQCVSMVIYWSVVIMIKFNHTGHKKIWDWLSKNPDKTKYDWEGWKHNGGQYEVSENFCFACEYDCENNDGDDNCDCCPLVWPDDVKCDDMKDGTAAFSLYEEWVIEPDLQFKSKLAAQIRDLPVRDGVECE